MEESNGGRGMGAPSSLSQAQHPFSSSLRPLPIKTLTNSRTKTDGRERHRLGDRLHTQSYTHIYTHRLAPSFGMVHPSPGDRV